MVGKVQNSCLLIMIIQLMKVLKELKEENILVLDQDLLICKISRCVFIRIFSYPSPHKRTVSDYCLLCGKNGKPLLTSS